jgi:hypothetical protein
LKKAFVGGQILHLVLLIAENLDGVVLGEHGHVRLVRTCVMPTRRHAADIVRNRRAS